MATSIRRIERTYDDLSRVLHVTSRSGSNSGSTIVNDILYAYDGWGNVAASYQDHAGAATTSDPGVVYHYADDASGEEAR